MLKDVEAHGIAAAEAAALRARIIVAERITGLLPGVMAMVEDDGVLLVGRIDPADPRLRWLASALQ